MSVTEKDTSDRRLRRHSFILTVWLESDLAVGKPALWRCSLEDPRTLKRHGFGSPAELAAFLRTWLDEPDESAAP